MTTEKFTTPAGQWITPIFILLCFYTFGASMMDSFVVYHTWRFVGPNEFSEMHIESGTRIVPVFVIPTLLMTIFLVLLFWHRAKAIPRKLVWAALICTIIPWLSSAFIQIPMQILLDKGKDEALLNALILTDWIRVVPSFGLAFTGFQMVRQVLHSE